MSTEGNRDSRPEGRERPGGRGDGRRGRGGRGRQRHPPVLAEVVSVSHLTPRLVSVRLGAADLARFSAAAPTAHIKVFLPVNGQSEPTMPIMTAEGRVWPEGQPRPFVRTYTPRAFDADSGTLEVQFVLHGAGPASEWAQHAKIGDKIAIGGPGGRFSVDPETESWWIGGDESALPAIGTLLDALPASATADVHLEVASSDDEIALSSDASTSITWHHRREPNAWGTELYEAIHNAELGESTEIWVACESTAVRKIRRHLLEKRQLPTSSLVTRGYWRVGTADHPDHDYGDD